VSPSMNASDGGEFAVGTAARRSARWRVRRAWPAVLCYRQDMWKFALCFVGFLFGCGDDRACTDADCVGTFVLVPVDDAGLPVGARGEVRNDRGITTFPVNGTYISFDAAISPDDAAEIHFELPDGSFTSWQPLQIEYERHTDPDFNGEGCSCTWYNARTQVVVPGDARLSGTPDAGD
jgi:hypothetical protein